MYTLLIFKWINLICVQLSLSILKNLAENQYILQVQARKERELLYGFSKVWCLSSGHFYVDKSYKFVGTDVLPRKDHLIFVSW